MKFKFKTQKYQVDAVSAVTDVFQGQPYIKYEEYTRDLGYKPEGSYRQNSLFDDNDEVISAKKDFEDDDTGFSNATVKISSEKLLENIRKIQSDSNLHESSSLSNPLGAVSLDIEMETGTGKTYVYLRTILC